MQLLLQQGLDPGRMPYPIPGARRSAAGRPPAERIQVKVVSEAPRGGERSKQPQRLDVDAEGSGGSIEGSGGSSGSGPSNDAAADHHDHRDGDHRGCGAA
jgi:hypothetical protein